MFSERKECDDIRKAFITDHSCYRVENEIERTEQGNQLGACWKKPWVICGLDHNGDSGSGLSFLNSIGNSIGNFKDKLA